MSDYELVSDYVSRAQRTSRLCDLEADTEAAVRGLGFDFFAILHHLDRPRPGAPVALGQVRLTNYPSSWREAIQKEGLVGADPVLAASRRSAVGFLWSDVPRMIELSELQRCILANARKQGLGEGYTVPVHIPGECLGSSSFALRVGRDVRHEALPMLHYLGAFAFEAGRKIAMAAAPGEDFERVQLTTRQIDCIVLAGRGRPARQAARELGIKQDTFQKYIMEAKQRMGVATTTELVVRSLFDGHVTFKDLFDAEIV